MRSYRAPLRDIQFVLRDVLDIESHYRDHGFEEADSDTVNMIIEEGARFTSEVITPLSQSGDAAGCKIENHEVTTPEGFKEAYQQYVEGGWPSLSAEADLGGQGLPDSLGEVINEMLSAADVAWGMYPGLSRGAMDALTMHGTDALKQTYLTKLIEGVWTGTMCLTESHCGSDLGLLRTKAEPNADGSYSISGEKIFISAGEHDMSDNIVHLVLARISNAPGGTKGISLFVVPKYLPDENGEPGERNTIKAANIEHKMGIKANATCVMVLDNAKGFLVGEENKGLRCMFTMMNNARIGVGMQGLGLAEAAYQSSLAYSQERLQMRSLSGPKAPDKAADPIIVHPDVRRMLLTQKALIEGNRALAYYTATLVDASRHPGDDEEHAKAEALLGLLTPIVKAFITETGNECVNLGLQCFGGHGYISEWGMEQLVRDARITLIYEGTTGIQALDLLGRKVLGNHGESLKLFTGQIAAFCQENATRGDMGQFVGPLAEVTKEWGELTMEIGKAAMQDREIVGCASVDYLMYSGYVCLAYFWARMARVAEDHLAEGGSDEAFHEAKLATARFYYKRVLPRTRALAATMLADSSALMELDSEHFSFG